MAIGTSLLLIAIGAILAFALQIDSNPIPGLAVDWTTIGVILMAVGVIGLIWAVVVLNSARRRDDLVVRDGVTTDRVVEDRSRRIYE